MTVAARDLLRFCEAELPWQLDTIVELVRHESPSDRPEALAACARVLARRAESLGARVSGLDGEAGVPHVRAELGAGAPRVLLIGHLDTVWPIGSLALAERDGCLYGPGVYDMKAGLAIAMQAIRALQAQGEIDGTLVLLCTIDEETGSERSRPMIEHEASQADAVLVVEPALANGGVKTGRKGVGDYRVEITGVSSHAGVEPERGASAIHELVRQAAIVFALGRPELGTTVNVGIVEGGTRSNVVAERAAMDVDVRVVTMAEAARVEAAMRSLASTDPRIGLKLTGGINRPPMERSAAVLRLYEMARDVARELAHELPEGATGGASDGNFTAALGIPTLDGLGAIGDGAHARHEHVRIDALPLRSAILAGLIARLTTRGPSSADWPGTPSRA